MNRKQTSLNENLPKTTITNHLSGGHQLCQVLSEACNSTHECVMKEHTFERKLVCSEDTNIIRI